VKHGPYGFDTLAAFRETEVEIPEEAALAAARYVARHAYDVPDLLFLLDALGIEWVLAARPETGSPRTSDVRHRADR
jgi:hypothetical protein